MARDGSSGGVIRTVTITTAGIEKECILGMCSHDKIYLLNILLAKLIYFLFNYLIIIKFYHR